MKAFLIRTNQERKFTVTRKNLEEIIDHVKNKINWELFVDEKGETDFPVVIYELTPLWVKFTA